MVHQRRSFFGRNLVIALDECASLRESYLAQIHDNMSSIRGGNITMMPSNNRISFGTEIDRFEKLICHTAFRPTNHIGNMSFVFTT